MIWGARSSDIIWRRNPHQALKASCLGIKPNERSTGPECRKMFPQHRSNAQGQNVICDLPLALSLGVEPSVYTWHKLVDITVIYQERGPKLYSG